MDLVIFCKDLDMFQFFKDIGPEGPIAPDADSKELKFVKRLPIILFK